MAAMTVPTPQGLITAQIGPENAMCARADPVVPMPVAPPVWTCVTQAGRLGERALAEAKQLLEGHGRPRPGPAAVIAKAAPHSPTR